MSDSPNPPTIVATGVAYPPYEFVQDDILEPLRCHVLGLDWETRPETATQGRQIGRLFSASGVERRRSVVDLPRYHSRVASTGERMAQYGESAYTLARDALERTFAAPGAPTPAEITDFYVISCTGYAAPGLDILLARDLGMANTVRRVVVGHMGCFGAMVGLREALAASRARPEAVVLVLCVELTTLHFMPTQDLEVLTSFALFGDAAAAAILRNTPSEADERQGPRLLDAVSVADFAAAGQMSWTITDTGFVMGLSPRVPVTLRRNIRSAVAHLLDPHGLTPADIPHWLIHPGGPSILQAIQGRLELSDAQVAPAWTMLREHGNCSSATVLAMLHDYVAAGSARPGERCVMMAFGPGLTLEAALLEF